MKTKLHINHFKRDAEKCEKGAPVVIDGGTFYIRPWQNEEQSEWLNEQPEYRDREIDKEKRTEEENAILKQIVAESAARFVWVGIGDDVDLGGEDTVERRIELLQDDSFVWLYDAIVNSALTQANFRAEVMERDLGN